MISLLFCQKSNCNEYIRLFLIVSKNKYLKFYEAKAFQIYFILAFYFILALTMNKYIRKAFA